MDGWMDDSEKVGMQLGEEDDDERQENRVLIGLSEQD